MPKMFAKLGRFVSIAILFIAATLLMLWPLAAKILPLNEPTQVFGVSIAVLAALMLDLGRRVGHNLGNYGALPVRCLSVAGAVGAVMERRRNVGTLRALANTTETILPTLRDSRISMKTCKVMVRDFSQNLEPELRVIAAKADGLIKTWTELPKSGAAESVTLKRVDFVPTYFAVIFDDRFLIFGLLVPTGQGMNLVHYLDPALVDNGSPEGQAFIDMFTKQFDDMFGQYEVYVEASRRDSSLPHDEQTHSSSHSASPKDVTSESQPGSLNAG